MPHASPVALTEDRIADPTGSHPGPDRAVRVALDAMAQLPALPMRTVPLGTCHDRVLGERVRADADVPMRDIATVDGFAFAKQACRGEGPWRLRLTARIAVARNSAAGNTFPSREAVRIAAGAPVPPQLDMVAGADTVSAEGDYVVLDSLAGSHGTIAVRGAYAHCGDVIAEPDRLLDARDLAGLAVAGCQGVKVRRSLRVAVLSGCTGKQEGNGGPGRAVLMAALDRRWITRQDLGAITATVLAKTLRAASAETDVVIAFDNGSMADSIVEMGGRIVLDGIAMQPGGEVRLATLGETTILLLPENPVAALTAMTVLGWPVLRRRAGIQHSRALPRLGMAAFTVPRIEGVASYPLVRIAGTGQMPTLDIQTGAAGAVSVLSPADGIALVAPGAGVGFGDQVAWLPITDRFA